MSWLVTKYHNLSSLNNRHLFLTVLESGKSKVKMGAWLSSDESTRLADRCLPAISRHGGQKESSQVSSSS